MASRTAWYAEATASASAALVTSSPRTSTVASFPSAFSPATVRRASSSVAPAMYGADRRWTTGRGTAGSRRTIARSTTLTAARFYEGTGRAVALTCAGVPRLLAHEALAGGGDERDCLREEHTHRVAERDRLRVGGALHLDARERRRDELHRRVQRQRRELFPLGVLDGLGLTLREVAQRAEEVLGIAAEREEAAASAL